MHSIIFVAAILATLTAANPVEKRDLVRVYETVTDVSTVTQVVTVSGPAPTPVQDNSEPEIINRKAKTDEGGDRPDLRVFRGGNQVVRVITVGGAQPEKPKPVVEQPKPAVEQPKPVVENKPEPAPSPVPAPTPQSTEPKQEDKPAQVVNSSGGGTSNDYQKTALDVHNECRGKHQNTAPLKWSDQLASIAQKHAETCVYEHKMDMDGVNYGQNIAAGGKASEIRNVIGRQFYSEEVKLYSWFGSEPNMGNFLQWGHFSQIVWAETTEVGCYTADCSSKGLSGKLLGGASNIGKHMTVCNYLKRGNMGGQYAENVKALA
ncbi:MAG: hypothetical protein M1823_005766 [Watsoniomyces obsoletus]|nr:MAG: hypothetical protein M1823_005766 [Watsoniomyces obsoletus]